MGRVPDCNANGFGETCDGWPRATGDTGAMATQTAPSGTRWRALGALLRPDAWRWAGLGVLVAISSALLITGPLIVRQIVDLASEGTTTAEITRLAVAFLVIAVVTQILAVIVVWLATVAAWRTTNDLRLTMTRHVLGLDHEFHRTHTPGELIQRVDGDITSVSDFLSTVVTKAAGAAMLIGGIIIVLTVLDWRLGLGMAIYVGLALAVIMRSRDRAVSESSEEMGALGRLYGGIEERLTAAEDLRANGAADHVAWRFVEDSEDALMSAVRRERAFLVMWWFVQGAVAAGWIVALVLGAVLVAAGTISIGTAFLLFQYVLLIARPLEEVVHELETVQKANGAMVRVADLLGRGTQGARRGRHEPAARAARDRRRRRALRLRRRPPGAARRHDPDRCRTFRRHRRSHRQREDHLLPTGVATRRTDRRCRLARWRCDRRRSPWPSCAGAWRSSPRKWNCSPARCATT